MTISTKSPRKTRANDTKAAPLRTRQKSAITRRRILDAAATEFSAKGYAGTRLEDIAARAEMKAGSLYYHFASREELVDEVLLYCMQWIYDQVRGAVIESDTDSPAEHLRIAIRAHLTAALKLGDYAAAHIRVVGQVPAELRRREFEVQKAYGAFWQKLFIRARDAGAIRDDIDFVAVRLLIVGALNWTIEWPRSAKRDLNKLGDTVEQLLFGGLQPQQPGKPRR